jgi:cyclic pyranopterin phosphate synthase
MPDELTHLDDQGALRMVDVGAKEITARMARALGEIRMRPETVELIVERRTAKGNVLEAARIAGIMAAKRTADLIPLCHSLRLTAVDLTFEIHTDRIVVDAQARVIDRTGVEMEALVAASVGLLTIYDMCKAVDRGMVISQVRLAEKRGGRSGVYPRPDTPSPSDRG